MLGRHVRRACQGDASWIDNDQPGALAQPLLHARSEDRMCIGRVGANEQDEISVLD
jgi:hypothetical protein